MKKELKTAANKMRLNNELGIEEDLATYVDGLSGVWIPPREGAELTKWSSYENGDLRVTDACLVLGIPNLVGGPPYDRGKIRGIWYRVPERLQISLEQGEDPDILLNGSIGFQQSLLRAGWHYKYLQPSESKKLVGEFLNLARFPLEEAGEVVREFVLRWGPMWLCPMHADCCWTPPSYSNSNPYNIQHRCRWFSSEPVVVFLAKAKQAEAAIEIGGYLSQNEHAPMEYWRTLNGQIGVGYETQFSNGAIGRLDGRGEADLWVQQGHLVREVNRFLTIANGPTRRLSWSRRLNRAVMVQDTGLGFFRLVWLQIAQTLCGGKGIFKCDGCLRYYIELKRKPAVGKHQFCPQCGGSRQRASKRLWARRSREANRQAPSLA